MNPAILNTIFQLALILFFTNIIRSFSMRTNIPPVIGFILLGVVLGPSLLNLIQKNEIINWIAEVGVLILIFNAGLETNLKRLKKESKRAIAPAVGGIVVPFLSGTFLCLLFGFGLIPSLLTGTIFTATSISISLMTLFEINKFNSIEGRCILNSAIIDDIIGIVILSIMFSLFANNEISSLQIHRAIVSPIIKILLFFIVAYLSGNYIIRLIFENSNRLNLNNSILSLSVAVIFFYAWFAELFGLAAIIGAFASGLIIGQTEYKERIFDSITSLGNSLFVDVFFVSIGLGLNLKLITFKPFFQISFIVLAIISKLIGSSAGALISRFDIVRSLRIGIGMIPRGEVALIVSSMAFHRKLIGIDIFSTTILMVIITSLIAPFLIKYSYSSTKKQTFKSS